MRGDCPEIAMDLTVQYLYFFQTQNFTYVLKCTNFWVEINFSNQNVYIITNSNQEKGDNL